MVAAPGEYAWSTFRSNGLGQPVQLWTPHEIYTALGDTPEAQARAYRELFRGHMDLALLSQIRQAANQEMSLGNVRFKQEIALLSGCKVNPLKRGPKPKSESSNEFLL